MSRGGAGYEACSNFLNEKVRDSLARSTSALLIEMVLVCKRDLQEQLCGWDRVAVALHDVGIPYIY